MSLAPAAESDFQPSTQEELSRWLADNSTGPARPVFAVGGGTSTQFGYPSTVAGQTVSTTRLDRVIDYPARDMTVTVEAGITIERLQQLLATERQRLPIDIPEADWATLGGVLATNASGSRRLGLGTMRDAVIGLSAVDAEGRLFKSGGRVVKNVAGYDLCKMLIGSLGTLAVVSQITLKLRPIPERSAILWVPLSAIGEAEPILERLTSSATRPVAIDLLDRRGAELVSAKSRLSLPVNAAVLVVGVEGGVRDTDWQLRTVQDEIRRVQSGESHAVEAGEVDNLWSALTEFPVAIEGPVTFKASLLPSRTVAFVEQSARFGCAIQAHAGSGIVTGHLPGSAETVESAQAIIRPVRQAAEACGGSLVVMRCDDDWKATLNVFGRSTPATDLMRTLKTQLDPRGLLNPRRLFGDM